jgi:hypothetical protein
MKIQILKYLIFFGLLAGFIGGGNNSFGQTAAFNNKTSGASGVLPNNSILYYSQTGLVLYGNAIAISGSAYTVNQMHFTSSISAAGYFANGKLYRAAGNANFSAATQITGTVTFTASGADVTGMSDPIAKGATSTYYIVADYTVTSGALPATIAFNMSTTNAIMGTTTIGDPNGGTGSDIGNKLLPSLPAISQTNLTNGLTAAGTITPGQTAIAMFGFSLNVTGNATVNTVNINSNNANLQGYFTNGKLYRSTSTTFNPVSPGTQVGTVTFSGTYATVTGLSEAFTSTSGPQTNNYFLVADYTVYTGTLPSAVKFGFTSGQSQPEIVSTIPTTNPASPYNYNTLSNAAANSYTITSPTLAVTTVTTGLTSTIITPGQTGIAMFGLSIKSTGLLTINGLNINSNNANLPGYFTNGKLYYSSTGSYTSGTPVQVAGAGVAGTSVTFSGSYASVSGLNESFAYNAGGTTRVYFLVADYTVYTGTTPSSVIYNVNSGQSLTAITGSYNYNTIATTGTRSYTINAKSVTIANVTTGVSGVNLYPGQTNISLFCYKVTVKGLSTFSQFNIANTNSNLQGYFANGKLYRNTTASLTGATQVAGTAIAGTSVVFNGNFVNITGLNEVYSAATGTGQSYYYYLVADYSVLTNPSTTAQFQFTTTQSPAAITEVSPLSKTYDPSSVTGKTFTLGTNVVIVAKSPVGLALNHYPYLNVPLFGFKATITGTTTISQININSNNANLSTYFSNGRLYRSTQANLNLTNGTATVIAGSTVAGTAVTFNGTYVNITGLNEVTNNPPTATKFWYYLVCDFTYGGPNQDVVNFNFTSGQTTPEIVQSSPVAANFNTFTFTESTFIIGTPQIRYWNGSQGTNWNTKKNWTPNFVPQKIDTAIIGRDSAFVNLPRVSQKDTVGSIIFGNKGGSAATLTVATGDTLVVNGDITDQSDSASTFGYTHILAGGGYIFANNLNIIANTNLSTGYTTAVSSSLANLNIANLVLTSSTGAANYNAAFNVTGGVANISGMVITTNGWTSTSTLSVSNGTLQFSGANPFSGLATSGNIISFNNTGATIEYSSSAAQSYYSDADIPGLTYTNIKFSGGGIKTVSTVGNLNITGDFTNTLTNDLNNFVDLSALTGLNFTGSAAQNLNGGPGIGTTLFLVNFSGNSTKTMASGTFSLSSAGVLSMLGTNSSNVLATGGLLTLNSDITGSATVAAINNGQAITGNVNVQRFLTGGTTTYRGYRLLSSAVNAGGGVYSMNYVINSCYVNGSMGPAGGFDAVGNPNLYLFRENLAPANTYFTNGNFRGVSNISAAPSYTMDGDGGPFNVPVGNGFLFFFRGDRSTSFASKTTPPYPAPENTTLTETGPLNQGQITVYDWYTPTSPNLGWTTTAGNGAVQGFNLVGNPYASSINWDTYNTTTSTTGIYAPNVGAFIYLLDPVSKNYNVYQAGTGGVGTIASANSNIIPSGQGFFVVATSASAQLIFNESAKTNGQASASNGNLFLGTPAQAAVSQYLNLKLLKDSVNADGIIINFKSGASNGFAVNEDAIYRTGNGLSSLSSMSADNIALAVNTMPLPKQNQVIPLKVNVSTDGIYQINMAAIKSIPAIYEIWLMDAYKKDSLDMRANATYNFNVYRADTNSFGAHRFTLLLRQNPAQGVHLLNFTALKSKNGSNVTWQTENEENYTNFTIERSTNGGASFDVIGSVPSSDLGTYSILDKNPASGANQYRLKIGNLNGTLTYSKVITLIYGNGNTLSNNISVFPNPSSSVINLAISSLNSNLPVNSAIGLAAQNNTPNVSYSIKIIDVKGTVIKSATSSQSNWQANVGNLLPGTYIIQVTNTSDNSVVGKGTFIKM